jgi:TrmH family RNA methyltransferase
MIAMTVIQTISAIRLSFTADHPSTGSGQALPPGGPDCPVEAAPVPTELSPHNPRIAQVRDLRTPRGRRAEGRFAAEGPTLLDEAARSGLQPREIYATAEGLGRFDAGDWEAQGVAVYVVPERVFARLSDLETPAGVLAVFDLPGRSVADVLAGRGPVLLLAGVSDPGNAGTLVRSAEAFGAAGVLFGRGGADPFAPKVVRAAMGSIFRLPVAQVDAEEVLAAAAAAGRPVVATDVDGEDLGVVGIPPNAVLAVGNERRGVRDWLPRWDRAVRIPQRSATESLNAAVAGSIVLYEASRCQDPCQVAEKA